MKTLLTAPLLFLLAACSTASTNPQSVAQQTRQPNVVYILADDLGYGEVGIYGQSRIKTPNIDALAARGMLFTQHYSGSTVCAPSRAALMTGQDTGRTLIRGNRNDLPLGNDTVTLGEMFKQAGYSTAAIGKWGLGDIGSTGDPNSRGFDYFYGFVDHLSAHNHYPTHLFENGKKIDLRNAFMDRRRYFQGDPNNPADYAYYKGEDYADDLFADKAVEFIAQNKERPFFLYLASTIPHAALQVPDDALSQYDGVFDEQPHVRKRSYYPHIRPKSAHAAMITRLDTHVGRVVSELERQGLSENTIVIFTSDNGPAAEGGVDPEAFDANGPLRGIKRDLYEGGIRVPMIASWPGHIAPGSRSSHISAFWDVMPTFAGIAGIKSPEQSNGISFLPTLLGKKAAQQNHNALYWEFHERGGDQAVRIGRWKAVRRQIAKLGKNAPIELYDLESDIGENVDVSAQHPEIVASARTAMDSRVPSTIPVWNFQPRN